MKAWPDDYSVSGGQIPVQSQCLCVPESKSERIDDESPPKIECELMMPIAGTGRETGASYAKIDASDAVVIIGVRFQKRRDVLAEDNEVIQTLTPDDPISRSASHSAKVRLV